MVFVQALKFHMQKSGSNELNMTSVVLNGSLLYSTLMEIQNFSSNFIQLPLKNSVKKNAIYAVYIQVLEEDLFHLMQMGTLKTAILPWALSIYSHRKLIHRQMSREML
jgi:hypothetical protein